MSSNAKIQAEDLKKLEDEAYFELCQIIAEAMQYQDVELLNSRISTWKTKYRKLLDGSLPNSKFKKKIEFLLTQYYSSVTQYILAQLKLKEKKIIENQSKALRKLYNIIKDTNDLDLLKKKVSQWEQKYPVSSFLKMYQKRIKSYTSEKNLKENAFEQEKAFSELVDITKVNGTLDELKNKLSDWEQKYSINNKYDIDDFIKHQSDIKRFTSDEFLISIARKELDADEIDEIDKTKPKVIEEYNNKSFSNLSIQESAYSSLLKICKSPNNVDQMFMWVYKNRYISFNDKYKELILNATYLNYRPQFLNSLTTPNIDILNTSLSFDEYKNIDEIKRYAIISYFNLLLPPGKSISNDYFNKHIQTIYSKSEKAKNSINVNNQLNPIENASDFGIEISLKKADKVSNNSETNLEQQEQQSVKEVMVNETPQKEHADLTEIIVTEAAIKEDAHISETIVDLSDTESGLIINLENTEKDTEFKIDVENSSKSTDAITEIKSTKDLDLICSKQKEHVIKEAESNLSFDKINKEKEQIEVINDTTDSIQESYQEEHISETSKKEISETTLNHETIVAFSPLFFETINNYNKQSVLVRHIDSTINEYLESEKTNDISLNEQIKTINDEE